jgi:hypothetical protein
VSGLALRIRVTGGAKTFVVFGRVEGGKPVRYTLGRYGDWTLVAAQQKAREIFIGLKNGIDPNAEQRKVKAEKLVVESQTAQQKVIEELTLRKAYDEYMRIKTHTASTR